MAKKDNHVWIISYINRDFISKVQDELNHYESLQGIEVYIPTIKLLKKKAKGKNEFQELPLLFNYGFFKVRYEDATNIDFLMAMRHRISCIYAWVKDPSKAVKTRPNLNVGNTESRDALPAAAIATDKEVSRMVKACKDLSIFDKEEIDRIEIGSYITLEGYPFDGIDAKILSINHKRKEVKVELQLGELFREVRVSFENVFYTVYKGFENKTRERSIEDMGDINIIDSLVFKNTRYEE